MTRGRNLITSILVAATILFVGSAASETPDDAPSPRMLLNLDLFTAPPPGSAGAPGPDDGDSTIDQLRALSAMGYLGPKPPPAPDPDDDPPVNFVPQPQGEPQ